MKKNAEYDKPFTLDVHVRERLDKWEYENGKNGCFILCVHVPSLSKN
jgi:hypothetical protein